MTFEGGSAQGIEMFLVRGGEKFGQLDDYFAYVQCANGVPGLPVLLKVSMESYEFTIPAVQDIRANCPAGEFHGTVSFDGIVGSFADGREIKLERRDSVWE